MKSHLRLLPLALIAAAACVIPAEQPPTPPPPPPPTPAPMTAPEAIERGQAWCGSHGYACQAPAVERGPGTWRVRFDAASPAARGALFLDFDARTHALARVQEPPPPPPPPAWRAPPPPPPAPRMTRVDAIAAGIGYCQQRGYASCRPVGAGLDGDVWLVDVDARRGPVAGLMRLGFDAESGALVAVDEPQASPPPPPPGPARMSYDEAVRRGYELCAQRGYQCSVHYGALTGTVWRIDYDARRPDAVGRLHVELDAVTRALLRVDEPRPFAAPPPQPAPYPRPPPVVVAPPPTPTPPPPSPHPIQPAPPPHPPPVVSPPPRPIPGPLTEARARQIGLDYCRARGYACVVQQAQLVRGDRVWRVHLEAQPPVHGHVQMEIDAGTGARLDVKDDVKPGPGHGHGHDHP